MKSSLPTTYSVWVCRVVSFFAFFAITLLPAAAKEKPVNPGAVTDYTVFGPGDAPLNPLNNDGDGVEVGFKLRATESGVIKAIRYYKGAGTTGTHIGNIWSSTGTLLATVTFTNETASGWQEAQLETPVILLPNITVVASVFSPSGDYGFTSGGFSVTRGSGPIKGLADGEDGANGIYSYSSTSTFPTSNYGASNYYVDVVFSPGVSGGILNGTENYVARFTSPVQLGNSLLFDNGTGVGIGTTFPGSYKLAVNGTIGARKIKVTQETWADYVFDEGYDLLSIEAVDSFISRNKHLPGVPSAATIISNGLDVGENQELLLKKIEEMTLYIIRMNKELQELRKLREELDQIKKELNLSRSGNTKE